MTHINTVYSTLTPRDRQSRIKHAIVEAGDSLKARYPFLAWQDTIGSLVILIAITGMVTSGWLWYDGSISAWLSIPLTAFFASLTHELEHDLIHRMYFRKNVFAYNLMLALCWIARPLTINPWLRRDLHFNHHLHSGTAKDIEEQAITNGEPWGPIRLLMISDGMMSVLVRALRAKNSDVFWRIIRRGAGAYFPLGLASWATWYAFLAVHLLDGLSIQTGAPVAWSATALQRIEMLDLIVVVLLAPNILRSFSINFVSSNMHFYGDIDDGNVIQQTQVLTPIWMMPMQLFCFNFGSTHAIHHFVVGQPFYVRQLVAAKAHPVMREMGVRFNDIGSFGRANRWNEASLTPPENAPALTTTFVPAAEVGEIAPAADYKKYLCCICFLEYDEAKGWPGDGIAPGTRWADVPETWTCPECGSTKAQFDMIEVEL